MLGGAKTVVEDLTCLEAGMVQTVSLLFSYQV